MIIRCQRDLTKVRHGGVKRWCALAVLIVCEAASGGEKVGTALERPALMVRSPERTVLLGVAQAGRRWLAVGERGIIVRSDDAGRSWVQAPAPVSVTLTAVRFADTQHGIAVGHGGTVLTTQDGGIQWERRLDGLRIPELMLADAHARGDAVAQKAAEQMRADGPDKPLLDVLMTDPLHALAVGAYGMAIATEDGGKSWASWGARLDNPEALHLYAVRQRGSRIVIAGEQGLVLKSDDGGQSFRRLSTPYKGSFFTLELPNEHEIVLAGLRGNVWRSTDGGDAWQQIPVPMPVSIVASQISSDGTLLLANQAGFVLANRDGAAFLPLNRAPLPPLNGLVAGADGAMLAVSIQGVVPVDSKP
ncbi:photosystem II stability/assembly factor-like uncharacterized protein [Rhodoferax ferrireducens]|uniref:Photosystem II stability/assembly factor-like uncharacterized protein n=1 Tax=Rhodoferax ferrireducens TaxID=192843 RepID=A0ABU2CDA4_9BURK|nr:YCF48-related protein [Rhodoferax ferrireducens]MDR7379305.1 photosystem II stability/assembly factor-like uncharacterized protein [Rhodoferax ferrireducens]